MNYKVIADSLKNRKIIRNNLKIKLLAFAMGASVFIGGIAFTQVPSYVPSSGLVGWWPFNGNANDESGNGNHGTVNGATLTADRFGNASKAYSFDGVDDLITMNSSNISHNGFSINGWFNTSEIKEQSIYYQGSNEFHFGQFGPINNLMGGVKCQNGTWYFNSRQNIFPTINQWINFAITYESNKKLKLFLNGILVDSSLIIPCSTFFNPGYYSAVGAFNGGARYFNGKIDDLGIWNRALTQQEITALYNGCGNEITSQPLTANINAGSTAQFTVNAISGSSFQWQSNPLNMGWKNITNNSSYFGATSNALSVNNVAVSNHNQPFRAIVNAGTCIDTSDIAQIIIGDTCLSTIYDTLLTAVTDTLIINTTLSLPSPNNANTIKIYPNPASDHITIDNGNFAAMAGYSIKITNNAGQQVFENPINQAQFYIDLSTWSGNGLYFVHLIDSQNNTVTIRKIVLQ